MEVMVAGGPNSRESEVMDDDNDDNDDDYDNDGDKGDEDAYL